MWDAKEAADHCLRPGLEFRDLKPGEVFRFPGSQARLVKGKRGYRHEGQSRVFYTGRKTRVILLEGA